MKLDSAAPLRHDMNDFFLIQRLLSPYLLVSILYATLLQSMTINNDSSETYANGCAV